MQRQNLLRSRGGVVHHDLAARNPLAPLIETAIGETGGQIVVEPQPRTAPVDRAADHPPRQILELILHDC